MPLNADARAGVTVNGKPSYTVDQAAVQLDRAGLSWSTQLGQAATVTYAYRSTAPATMPDDTTGFTRFTAAQITGAEMSLKAWSDVANITFVRVGSGTTGDAAYSNNATILLGDYSTGEAGAAAFTYFPGSRAASSASGDVWVLGTDANNQSPTAGSYGLQTLTHELGHAIGLSHPSDYNVDGSTITYANNASYYEDSREYSIMSYFASSNTGGTASIFAVAPQLDDIAAAQRLYGANYTTRTGDDVYGFHSNIASDGGDRPWYELTSASDKWYAAIWDGGGNDTLDFSLYTQNQKIDLHEGSFSDVGGDIGNLAIAVGAKIENAIGGLGNDAMYGNGLNNRLDGGAGNDTIYGGQGDDTLIGGSGANYLSGDAGNDRIIGTGAGDTLYGGDGDDVITSTGGSTLIVGNAGNDLIIVSGASSTVYGGKGDDNISASGPAGHYLSGDIGNDTIVGGSGNDTIVGGQGHDLMAGGGGANRYVYLATTDSPVGDSDWITDFNGASDKVDVSALFTQAGVAHTAFHFVTAFDGGLGEATAIYNSANNTTTLQLDINGDKVADLNIYMVGKVDAGGWVLA